jgi:hypothetical protein
MFGVRDLQRRGTEGKARYLSLFGLALIELGVSPRIFPQPFEDASQNHNSILTVDVREGSYGT